MTKEQILHQEAVKACENPAGKIAVYSAMDRYADQQTASLREQLEALKKENEWISVEDRPLVSRDEFGNWECTEDGSKDFIAAVQYNDADRPNNKNLWWIRHCVIEDQVGLCTVGDDENVPAGWGIDAILFFKPLPQPPK